MAEHLMGPEHFELFGWAHDVELSPDARRLVWSEISMDVAEDRPVMGLMIAPSDGSEAPRLFTNGPTDFSPRFSPDGRSLAYLSASDGPPALMIAPLDGGAPTKVAGPGPVGSAEWSPAGTSLVLVVEVRDETAVEGPAAANAPTVVRGVSQRRDGEGWHRGRRHLFVYDVATTQLRRLTRGDYDHHSPCWSPDGKTIAFLADRQAGHDHRLGCEDLWRIPASGGRPQRITRGIGSAGLPSYSPDGRLIAFSGVERRADLYDCDTRLLVVDATGSESPRRLVPGLDRPVTFRLGPSRTYAWLGPDEIAFNVVDAGTISLWRARISDARPRPIVTGDLQATGLTVAGRGRAQRIAYEAAWVDTPSEVFTVSPTGASLVKVSRAGERLASAVRLLGATRHTATAPDGLSVEYFLMSAASAPARRSRDAASSQRSARSGRGRPAPGPLYMDVHGGPSLYNPISQLFPYYQALAGAGYSVVLPNPRGGIGYGESFRQLSIGDWGGADYADLMACCDDAVARGLADGRRQFVGGYSYGGFMTSWIVGQTDRFDAAIIGAPVVDHVSLFGTTDIPWFLAASLRGDPWSEPDEVRYRSPLTHLPNVTTPVLLHVNEGDLRCPHGQADELYAGLVWLKKKVEYVRYPGGSHLAFFPMAGMPSQSRDRAARFLEFLGRHGGKRVS